jgi:hypothetical protein
MSELSEINKRIKTEICYNSINELCDKFLLEEYKKCISVKKEINKLETILKIYIKDNDIINKILNDYLLELIPAGTKGVIRGNKFNTIVKNYILKLNIDSDNYEIQFEKKCEYHITTEIPDWYILDKYSKKIIIGMNQLDLWNGGHQLNRGFKYIENNKHNTNNSKLLCVICNDIYLKTNKNKIYKIFKIGFENNTLCYLNNLDNIIYNYFNLTDIN